MTVKKHRDTSGHFTFDRTATDAHPTVHANGQRGTNAMLSDLALKRLSFSQESFWLIESGTATSGAYNLVGVWELDGDFDRAALEAAFATVVLRHESLGGHVRVVDGFPYWEKDGALAAKMEFVDLCQLTSEERVRRIQFDEAECYRPFSLEKGPLIRLRVLAISPTSHVLYLIMHHIVADGYSFQLVLRELSEFYNEKVAGIQPKLMPVRQFTSIAKQEQDILEAGELDDARNYWLEQLSDSSMKIAIAPDEEAEAVDEFVGSDVSFCVNADLMEALKKLAAVEHTSIYVVFATAFAIVLSQYAQQELIVLGTSLSNRARVSARSIVGPLARMVPLRFGLDRDLTLACAIRDATRMVTGAFRNVEYPFESIIRQQGVQQSLAQAIQAEFNFHVRKQAEVTVPHFSGLAVRHGLREKKRAKSLLRLTVQEGLTDAEARLEYRVNHFSRKRAKQIVEQLMTTLKEFDSRMSDRLSDLPCLSVAEHQRLVVDLNSTERAIGTQTYADAFEAQVRCSPDRVAIVDDAATLTYAELNARANQLARYLRERDVGPDRFVAIACRRSAEMVVCIVAVLKAGGAFLPIDPSYPEERIALMLAEARPCLVLCEQDIKIGAFDGFRKIIINEVSTKLAVGIMSSQDLGRLDRTPSAMSGAYVIFTSGSTGKPKGVVGLQEGLVNRARWFNKVIGAEAPLKVLAKSSLSFIDGSTELLSPLLGGSSIFIVSESRCRDVLAIKELIAREGISCITVVPSLLAALLEQDNLEELCGCSTWICSGERLPRSLSKRFKTRFPRSRLFNLYGSSEASGDSLFGECGGHVYVGLPIWNTQVHVLGRSLEPVPRGTVGELYISGHGLSRGYLHRPGLTAERFIPDPFGPPGGRMYRTGDLAKWTGADQVDLAGRIDSQINIRGFRIEPREIEDVILDCGSVDQAVVLQDDGSGSSQLVAFVGARLGVSTKELKEFCKRKLPYYMVPFRIEVLAELPRSPAGKIDREALSKRFLANFNGSRAPEELPSAELLAVEKTKAGSNAFEQSIADLFASTLGLGSVSAEQSFFDLGGHSLIAARLISRIKTTLNTEVSFLDLFEAPTAAQLALRLQEPSHRKAQLGTMKRPAEIPLSFGQERLWFLYKLGGSNPNYNMSCAFDIVGELNTACLQEALVDLVDRHEILRTVYVEGSDGARQCVLSSKEARPALEVANVDGSMVEDALHQVDSYEFDLDHEIPLRSTLFVLGPKRYVLLFVLHHIAGDGWSLRPLMRDISAAYEARQRGSAPDWAPLAVQYADFTLWQRASLGDERDATSPLAKQLLFWRQALSGVPAELALPIDRPRPKIPSYRGASLNFEIDVRLSDGLYRLAREEQASLFMVLHSSLVVLLTLTGAGEDIPIGTPIAARTDVALDDLIGLIANMMVFRTSTRGNPNFRELLRRVRSNNIGAYDNQDLPFSRLVEAVNPPRSLSRHPLFQVMIAVQNIEPATLAIDGTVCTPKFVFNDTTKLDLSFFFNERVRADRTRMIEGRAEYAVDLFDEHTVAVLINRWLRILSAVVSNPDLHMDQIELRGG